MALLHGLGASDLAAHSRARLSPCCAPCPHTFQVGVEPPPRYDPGSVSNGLCPQVASVCSNVQGAGVSIAGNPRSLWQ